MTQDERNKVIAEAKIYLINWRCNDNDERSDVEAVADFAIQYHAQMNVEPTN